MRMRGISPSLQSEIENRIVQLDNEQKYMDTFWDSIMPSTGSSAILLTDGAQRGTTAPRWFGALDTFIANPSNVGIGIMARMVETDDTVGAAVMFKSMMMLSKIGEYQHEDPEIEDFVRDFISRLDGKSWAECMEGQSSAGAYGFSISEIIWGINKKNQKVPMRIETYHPSTICFEVDPFGRLTPDGVVQFVIQNSQVSNPNFYFPYFQYGFKVKNPFETPNDRLLPYRMPFINNYGLARIPTAKCIHHVNNPMLSFGSPYGKSPVRTAHLAWQMKVFFMRQLGIAGKRHANPFVWATAPFNVNQVKAQVVRPNRNPTLDARTENQMNAVDALADLLARRESDDSVVTGPENLGYKIEAIASQMDLNQMVSVVNFLNVQIMRAFLLPSLVLTDGTAGSRSLGDKHFQIVDWIAGEDAKKFGSTIINQPIRKAIIENFGEQKDYGHFAERPQSIEERERLANMFRTLGDGGWLRNYDETDGEFVRSSLHLPKQEKSFYNEQMPNFDPPPGGIDSDEAAPADDKGDNNESNTPEKA